MDLEDRLGPRECVENALDAAKHGDYSTARTYLANVLGCVGPEQRALFEMLDSTYESLQFGRYDPTASALMSGQGFAEMNKHCWQDAAHYLDEASRLCPDSAQPYIGKSLLARDLGHRQTAVSNAQQAVQTARTAEQAHNAYAVLGLALAKQGRYCEALSAMQAANEAMPGNAQVEYLIECYSERVHDR